ncbi:helix-turn-helix domain-containing protein [uncultured Cloacibacillus sp.]|uniref:helix-turn-helix domain-containing protein n=1 Tax=uncultured Cloacibacillus sp. TaxID=889794 RepID=UPI0032097C19
MKRISFDDDAAQRMSNVLSVALGNVAQKPNVDEQQAIEAHELEGKNETQDDYERRKIMESVARAKARSRLKDEGVSAALPAPTVEAHEQCPCRLVPLPLDALCAKDVGISERLVYLLIYANVLMGKNNLSIRELSDALHIAKSSVSTSINTLRGANWLDWEAPRNGKSRQNHYRVLRWAEGIPKIGDIPNFGEYTNAGELPNIGNSDVPKIGEYPNLGNYPKNGNNPNFDNIPENGDIPKIETCEKSVAVTGFVDDVPEIGESPKIGNSLKNGDNPNFNNIPKIGDVPKNGDIPNFGDIGKNVANTGFVGDVPRIGESLKIEYIPESGKSPNFGERGKIVDTTEFRRDLIGILREVKSRDLKDLKDIKILKDLKEKNIKISDFVDNLCITHVDNSMVAEYVSVMFRIAFPGQSTERLQVVKKLTERLQVGFAWYVVLLFIIRCSPFLLGKEPESQGWKCTLTWALAADNYPNIMDQLKYVKYGLRWTPSNFIEYICRALEKGEY